MKRTLAVVAALVLVVLVVAIGVNLFDEPTCPNGDDSPVPVLVGKQLIPEGTPAFVLVERRLFATAFVRCVDRQSGAIADPTELAGKVAVVDVFPGQQLTEDSFADR